MSSVTTRHCSECAVACYHALGESDFEPTLVGDEMDDDVSEAASVLKVNGKQLLHVALHSLLTGPEVVQLYAPIPKISLEIVGKDILERFRDGLDLQTSDIRKLYRYVLITLVIIYSCTNNRTKKLLSNHMDFYLLFDILYVFIGRYVTDFCFVREFLEKEVIPYLLIPCLHWAFERYDVDEVSQQYNAILKQEEVITNGTVSYYLKI
uniref:Nuclear pore complex protein n=1 Tax=Heterorhabditis bacteriophora TaxID=37862 RepID=A0A1I7X2U9_HETBA